jgi:DNA-binding transcriptional ArsR family regulator
VVENSPLAELAIGRSTVRQRILALLMYGPETRLHLRGIQRRVGTSPGTASRELAKLVAAGLVDREAEGSQVYFRATSSPIATMMRHLLLAQADRPVAAAPARMARARRPRPDAPATAQKEPAGKSPRAAGDGFEPTPAPELAPPVMMAATASAGPDEPAEATSTAETPRTAETPEPAESSVIAPPEPAESSVRTADAAGPVPDPLALVVAARFSAAIRALYGDRLKAVFLYGARATAVASEDADVELLVVLDAVARYGEELERTSAVCAQLSYELGLVVSRIFVAQNDWSGPGQGLVAVLPDKEGEA